VTCEPARARMGTANSMSLTGLEPRGLHVPSEIGSCKIGGICAFILNLPLALIFIIFFVFYTLLSVDIEILIIVECWLPGAGRQASQPL
jgi:hypothetical protein